MQVVVRSAAGEREVDIDIRNPDATVADLLRSATAENVPAEVAIQDRVVVSSCPLSEAGLYAGAEVSLAPSAETRSRSNSGFEVAVVAGLDAGSAFALPVGRSVIGRGRTDVALSHATVSRQHCAIEVDADGVITVTDLGSQNATVVDGRLLGHEERVKAGPESVIEVGAVALELRLIDSDDRPKGLDLLRHVGPGGTIPFNRPPRPARPTSPPPLEIPKPPTESSKIPFSIAAVVGPLILAVVMVQAYGPNYALFALLSPVIAIGSWLESRHRNKRKGGKDRLSYEEQLEKLRRSAEEAAATERARLRQLCPDPAEALRRAALPSVRIWERRSFHDDFLQLSAGLAKLSWQPPVKDRHSDLAPEVKEVLESRTLEAAPVCVDLSAGGVVGIVGDRAASLALARNLVCQAATHHGPADLTIGVFVDPGRGPDWEWAKWLPHTRNASAGAGARWLSERRESSDPLLRALAAGAGNGTVLVVLDSDVLTEGTNAPARNLLQPQRKRSTSYDRKEPVPVAGVVLAPTADRLPAACNTVIELTGQDGDGAVHRPEEGVHVEDVLVGGLSTQTARRCARDLARFEDPELAVAGSGLPDGARLLPLLGLDRVDATSVRKRWRHSGSAPGIATPLGVTEDGVFVLDLERDGPHGLIAGTTGSGKSELLRSLVAGLAAHTDPNHLTFVLVDYKGGAAFDECSRLPHTVGMVTDLDEQLGERALRALEAELHYRERLLRQARADNLRDYLAKGAPEPLPRLVVIIDEFATMAAELPDFISSLVGIAQRGRTLGVHMILATQRPSGAVNDNIRANTNLRIALRVQDAADSADVIGSRDAAELSRNRPGRAFVRLGPEETVPIQTALVTCVTDEQEDAAVDVAPFLFGPTARAPESEQSSSEVPTRSDLARLVDAIVAANEAEGFPPPRRPWPEPLPARVDLAQLIDAQASEPAETAVVALADDPARQQQYPVGWDLAQGNLLLFGIPGSGLTSTLLGCAVSLASKMSPEELEIYALDFGVGELKVLEDLPHTGSVILPSDRERQMRFVRYLRAELARRRNASGPHIRTLVLVDNFSAMRAEFGDIVGLELMDQFTRVFADGPEVNISLAMTADRVNAVPGTLAALTPQKWLYRLAESSDYSSVGLGHKHVPRATPGRAVMVEAKQQIQVGTPAGSWTEAVAGVAAGYPSGSRRAAPIGVLPSHVLLDELGAVAQLEREPWSIPVGLRESDLTAATVTLYEGEHVTIAGPARSGKSTTLWTIAESVKRGNPVPQVFAAGGRRSPLRDCPAVDRFAGSPGEANALIAQVRIAGAREQVVVLIDDANSFDDLDGAIGGLLAAALPHVHVVSAAGNDVLRGLYGHWTQTVRRSKVGVLLRPNIDLDGDLLGVTLPRRSPVPLTVGRGYLVQNGEYDIVQVASMPST